MSFLNNFIQKYNNKAIDFDKHYGHQCMDLANQYRLELTGLNPNQGIHLTAAFEVFHKPKGFFHSETSYIKIANNFNDPNQFPKPSDIIVWDKSMGSGFGHIAIITEANANGFEVLEQNGGSGDGKGADDFTKLRRYGNYAGVLGWLRIQEKKQFTQKIETPNMSNKENTLNLISQDPILNPNDRIALTNGVNNNDLFYLVSDNISYRKAGAKLQEQNTGLSRQLGETAADYTKSLADRKEARDQQNEAEEKTRQQKTIIRNLEIDHKQDLALIEAGKVAINNLEGTITRLNQELDGKAKKILEQDVLIQSKPKVKTIWDTVEFIKGRARAGEFGFLSGLGLMIVGIIASPQFLDLIEGTNFAPFLVLILPYLASFAKNLSENKK